MSLLETLALSVMQGLTEFLPVSSSGHLVLTQALFGNLEENRLPFFLVLHLGTVLAAVLYYRRDVAALLLELPRLHRPSSGDSESSRRLLFLIAIATSVTAVVGFSMKDLFLGLFESTNAVGVSLLITGAILLAASLQPQGATEIKDAPWWWAVCVGLAQGAAIVPGISRSGSTIAACLLLGLSRVESVRFSFLLAIPAVTGAALLEVTAAASPAQGDLIKYLAGFFIAAIVGYLSIVLVLKWTRKGRLWYFTIYLWAVATAALVWL